MTTRRRFVGTGALLGAALLAGCTGGDGGGEETGTETPTETGTGTGTLSPPGDGAGTDGAGDTRPEGTGGPAVTLASVDQRPRLPIRPTVEVVRDAATDDHPPRLRVTVENGADEPVTLGEARAVVFQYVTAESEQLILLPPGEDYPAEAGCWRLKEGIAVTEEYRTVTLDPGEAHSSELDLYGAPTEEDACLPAGEHRFETVISASTGGGLPANGTTATTDGTAESTGTTGAGMPAGATWGFSVLLE
ncbi:hypothetical protein [Candidatus Halobonum tyrrellensis]|uniref:Uncharacterized protein n=1 Tax=Candidatus Halobonum tyrrellensis G22 TaxID=1324957 RepID=V4J1M5_9EURY|nr:hypothetical protein [Candidatus Halobonum tyrrellensis]ESP89307.1 hypothetical protein K933_04796 [Candidatus Halobonum tyrrellensis G22]